VKPQVVISRTILLASIAAGITLACGDTQTTNQPLNAAPPPKLVTVNDLQLKEPSPDNRSYQVRDGLGKVDLKRKDVLSYDISFVTPSGERRTLIPPTADRPVNPIVDSRTYDQTNITCANSFANTHGENPRIDCFLIDASTGNTLDKLTVYNVWLRSTAQSEKIVFVSPESPIVFEEGYGMVCRAITVTRSGQLVYDANTRTPCSENKDVIPSPLPLDTIENAPEPGRDSIRTKNFTTTVNPETQNGKTSPKLPSRADFSNVAMVNLGGGPEGPPNGDNLTPVEDFPGCTGFPESDLQTTYHGPFSSSDWNSVLQTAVGTYFNPTFMIPDFHAPGYTFGVDINPRWESWEKSDVPLCLDKDLHQDFGVHANFSFLGLSGFVKYDNKKQEKTCGQLECTDDSWSCNHMSSQELSRQNIHGGLSWVLPLDKLPWFRFVCHRSAYTNDGGAGDGGAQDKLTDWRTWLKWGISCNLSLGGHFGREWSHTSKEGFGVECGSGCVDGRSTFSDIDKSYGGLNGRLQLQASFGMWAEVTGGIELTYDYSDVSKNELTCESDHPTDTRSTCHLLLAKAFFNFQAMDFLQWGGRTWTGTLFRTTLGESCAPPEDAPPMPSSGHDMGWKCLAKYRWIPQIGCEGCCDQEKANIPLMPGESESSNLADCKKACQTSF
jgi:hypothetical protein